MDTSEKKNYTVLIVEDNELNREILGDILSEDYNVLYAENGKIAMEQLYKYKTVINIVLLDINMPVMNGYDVLKAVSADPDLAEIPIIVTTSNDRDQDEEYCLRLGASDFVPKPYNPVIVRLRIETILRLLETTRTIQYKTSFMQNLSHEIRTPLAALYGFAQLLSQPAEMVTDDERREYSKIINTSYNVVEMLLNDLFDTSDFDRGHFKIKITSTRANDICRNALLSTSFKKPADVEIKFTSEVPDDYTILTDGRRIQQVLINFITNACKNTTKGEIHLHCGIAEHQGKLTFSVSDTGIGVPPNKAELIFTRFTKLDSFKPGAGLGLYICKIIAEKLNGDIYLDKNYKGGARFVFEIEIKN